MKTAGILLFFVLLSFGMNAQTAIKGKVSNKKGGPIVGANVYFKNTYDGVSSDKKWKFYNKH